MKFLINRKNSILRRFYPRERAKSTFDINYEDLRERGFKGIVFDIDNTLVGHDAPANEQARNLVEKIKELGFAACVVSNNSEKRVKDFAENLGLLFVFDAKKPSRKGYRRAMKLMKTNRFNTVSIGDQIFTDVFGANRTGMHSILVSPLAEKEKKSIKLKRKLEKIVLFFYKREKPDEDNSNKRAEP